MRKIRKGDDVVILRGDDRGRTGKVMDVDTKSDRVKVEGLNLVKKHRKRSAKNLKATIEDVPAPLPMAAVALASKKDRKAVRVHVETRESAGKVRKVRVATRTQEVFD